MTAASSKAITTDVQPDWEGRYRIAADRLEQLRRERGVAHLEGKSFDHRVIHEAEAEVDALSAAQVESTRRRRLEIEAEIERQRADMRLRLAASLDARSKAMIEAEAGCYKLASALNALFAESKESSALLKALGGSSFHIEENNVRLRAAFRIANILGPVIGKTMGGITLPVAVGPNLPDGTSVRDSWQEADAIKIADDVGKILKSEQMQ